MTGDRLNGRSSLIAHVMQGYGVCVLEQKPNALLLLKYETDVVYVFHVKYDLSSYLIIYVTVYILARA